MTAASDWMYPTLMGAWGPGIFSDDVACDIRDTYRQALEEGLSDAEATRRTLDHHAAALADEDDAGVVWMALALTQWKLGRVDDTVVCAALAVIDDERGLARWREQGPKAEAARRAALTKARATLGAPPPPRRAVRRPRPRVTDLAPGDVLAYRTTVGAVVLMRVIGLTSNPYFTAPRLAVLDYEGTVIPDVQAIEQLTDRRPSTPGPSYRLAGFTALSTRGHDWRDEGFERVGQIGPRSATYPDALAGSSRWDSFAARFEAYARRDAG